MFDWQEFRAYRLFMTTPETRMIYRCFQKWADENEAIDEDMLQCEVAWLHVIFKAGWICALTQTDDGLYSLERMKNFVDGEIGRLSTSRQKERG